MCCHSDTDALDAVELASRGRDRTHYRTEGPTLLDQFDADAHGTRRRVVAGVHHAALVRAVEAAGGRLELAGLDSAAEVERLLGVEVGVRCVGGGRLELFVVPVEQ